MAISNDAKHALDLSANAITVLEKRYLIKDDQGKPTESSPDLFWRVARTIAEPDRRYGASAGAVEALAEAFFGLMAHRMFMPNSPTLMNAGRELGHIGEVLGAHAGIHLEAAQWNQFARLDLLQQLPGFQS